ncbi:MAG: hypothetical protein KAT46_06490 [Deltaproteobacteria bacterium]|nr:hypothetical protein [Deltaproteobacteria bacterium]
MKLMITKVRSLVAVLAVFAMVLGFQMTTVNSAEATDGWESRIVIAAGTAKNKLSVGQKADATNGQDGQYDAPAMLKGELKAYSGTSDNPLWRDIKGLGNATWNLNIESERSDATITISWDSSTIGANAILVDSATGAEVDMNSENTYAYSNTGPRNLSIVVAY